VTGMTSVYYYNDKWQVLCEYDFYALQRWYAYGNYIDEVLVMGESWSEESDDIYYYAHDHLYSPVALVRRNEFVLKERYEYDAYGNCTILSPTYEIRDTSDYENSYLFTGRRLDILDNGSLKLQYNRNRYYDQYTGRWLTHDPLGITPNPQWPNSFEVTGQYSGGASLYEYGGSSPASRNDGFGLLGLVEPPSFGLPPEWRRLPPSIWESPLYEYLYCCPNLKPALKMANEVMKKGTCKEWFEKRWLPGRRLYFSVEVRPEWSPYCLAGVALYTRPWLSGDIMMCSELCCWEPKAIAALLIHEIGHHYCPFFGTAEACADSAAKACFSWY
jgi:RHS repeat-associated protein